MPADLKGNPEFELAIYLKSAKALGLDIPPTRFSLWVELNNRHAAYETAALPLSYTGFFPMLIGSPSWIRTTILAFKVRHPAVRRRGIEWSDLRDLNPRHLA